TAAEAVLMLIAVLASLADYMIELSDELKVVDDEYWENYPECPEGGGLLDAVINAEGEPGENTGDADAVDGTEESFDPDEPGGFIYENTQQFISDARGAEEDQNLDTANIGVTSGYFLSRVTVTRDDVSMTQYTTLFRDNTGAMTTLRRSRGGL
ncbi:MAG: hypothetical protein AAF404_19785, partial [Pseudomonadota bacterium]